MMSSKQQTTTLQCPRSMVGRVIGKNGETVKALQTYTGATIQIDQTTDPTRVSVTGPPYSLSLAVSMVTDIVRGSFKGFALLRQATRPPNGRGGYPAFTEPRPVYAPGYGLIPASQLYDDRVAPPMPTPYGLRPTDALLQQQQVYPMIPAGLPTQNMLHALQQDGSLAPQGAASLVNAQLGGLSLPGGDLGLAGNGMQPGMPYQEPYMLGPMGNGLANGNGVGGGEDFSMSASHRLIQAAGGGGRGNRPKPWLG